VASVLFLAGNTRSLIANRGDLVRSIQAAGHEVQALVPAHDLLPEIEELGIRWQTVSLRRAGVNPIADLQSALELRGLIADIGPDKVFAYTIKPIVYGLPVSRWVGVPEAYAMITGMGYLFTGETLKQRLLRAVACRLYRQALKRADAVFFQNPDDRALFGDLGILGGSVPTVMVNGSGVNTERFRPVELPEAPLVFLVISRLLEDKGLMEFVAASERLKSHYPGVRFQLLGPHDPGLPHAVPASTVEAWRSNPAVELLGHQKDVRPFIERAHVYVLPSYREGTPRSVLEAMSMGRPIITSDAPGCRETVIEGENGFLVPPRTVEPLARAMLRFIEEPSLVPQMGRRSRQIAEEKYDVTKVNGVIMRAMGLV
jgi:glycosyltransferase involved in cell wall biosynthesis